MPERHLKLVPPPKPEWKQGSAWPGWLVLAIVLATLIALPFIPTTPDHSPPSYAECLQDDC